MSRDSAFALLFDEFRQISAPALWLVDDNLDFETLPAVNPSVHAFTNRFDIYQGLTERGWQCDFCDGLENVTANHYHTALIRIPKEKARAHHLINQAAAKLVANGKLIITGMKQEGIKGFIDRAAKAAHSSAESWKADKQTWAAAVTINQFTPLDDQDYLTLRQAPRDESFHFWSKPGVFGWDKIDKGSALLVEHLRTLSAGVEIKSLLDLGCGYGYLSLHSHRLLGAHISATDNNAAAVAACRENFAQFNTLGEVIASDCGKSIESRFDAVICNPPFHSGFGISGDLTERFIQSAARHLTSEGVAIFVTNLHIGLERKAQPYFQEIATPVVTEHFKLIRLRQPR
ncbi:methyltransferase [Neptunomonas marina]|uniref:Class I SAM-dependent methyltransferase n=1 Tax=Neptunomonas marina TaxID=1815562 RepID=A0A437Q3Z3_9GAMM|nr:methyltransferase [Neptunomonas marina]RVU29249.1 class I SAM-dependent methyltransferase [Neptunomonas marina]